ncbi:hypothetical protein [Clostridium sp. DJ247]|uniref:hypothetical protein n=1 Tax=Clostridium sp. DJ247 TaxID=2726188 RepID=UPI001627D495|nr:hypothetical protein [Clostridium sp. DJ247]MBC2580826.1 hypothetical protein [Clostridium sp. DJ247]
MMIKNGDLLRVKEDEVTIYKILLEERVRNGKMERLLRYTTSLQEVQGTAGISYSIATLEDANSIAEINSEELNTDTILVAEGKAIAIKKLVEYDEFYDEYIYSESWKLTA